MVVVKSLNFFHSLFFRSNRLHKKSFITFWIKNQRLYTIKIANLKSRKIFMVLVKNLKFFPSLFFRSNRPILKQSFMMFQIENQPFYIYMIKTGNLKRGKICNFLAKIGHCFSNLLFVRSNRPKTSFMTFQIENWPFYTIKTSNLKSGKICSFPKGLVHGLSQKFAFFYPVFFRSNGSIKSLS